MSKVIDAAVGVLAVSNESPVDHWRMRDVAIQPRVWLSVLSTIVDALHLYALAEGATISF